MNRLVLATATLATLAACATTQETGWQGSAAIPFDTARRHCEAQVVRQMKDVAKEAAFEACMAEQGWRRP